MPVDVTPDPPNAPVAPPVVLCLRCGYDLRGLAGDAACPECGLGVGRSIQGQRQLHRGRPAWIGRLRAGAWLMLAAALAPVAEMIVGMLGGLEPSTPGVAVGLVVVPLAGHAAALLLLTSRENRFERRQPGNGMRVALRLAVLDDAWIAVCAAKILWSSGRPQSVYVYGLIAGVGLLAVIWGLTFAHLRPLARRVLDRQLAEHCLIVGVGLPAAVAAVFFLVWRGVDLGNGTWGLVPWLSAVVSLCLFAMWTGLLLAWFGVAFGRAARTARTTWDAADAASG